VKQVDATKFRDGFKEKIKPTTNELGQKVNNPFVPAHVALMRATFADKVHEQFFHDAFVEILSDLFAAWIKTEPHAQKEREYLYHSALALGSVKEQLIKWSMYGNNVKAQQQLTDQQQAAANKEGSKNE